MIFKIIHFQNLKLLRKFVVKQSIGEGNVTDVITYSGPSLRAIVDMVPNTPRYFTAAAAVKSALPNDVRVLASP